MERPLPIELAKETDLIIAVGTRLTDFTTASRTQFQNPDVRFLAINVTPMDASKLSALPLVADAKRALVDLTAALKGHRGTSEDYRGKVTKLKEEWDKRVTEIRTPKDKNDVTEIEAIGLINEAVGVKRRLFVPPEICPVNCCDYGVRMNRKPIIWNTDFPVWGTKFRAGSV